MEQFIPITQDEVHTRGWDLVDIVLVTGDAYVDHPSFGTAVIGRVLENAGFRVAVLSQPDWHSKNDFQKFGKPGLFFGISAGNMDSMVNKYTSLKKVRNNDAYSEGDLPFKRPDRAAIVYSHRAREAFKDVPIIIGGIEASLRRFAHYDYWSDKIRRSILADSKADLLVYGMGENQILEIAKRLSAGENIESIRGIRGTVFLTRENEFFDDMIERHVTNQSAIDSRERHCYNEGISSDDPRFASDHLALGRIAKRDWGYSRILDRLLLYERRIENSLYKTINRLKQYQVIRQIQLDETLKPSPSVKEEAAGHSQPAYTLSDLKKQSQYAAAHLGAKPLMQGDYNNNPACSDEENKANRSQSQALESTKGVGTREKSVTAANSLTG